MKQFIIACSFFLVASLSAIFGLTVFLSKVLVPPTAFDGIVTNYLGKHGPLAVVIVFYMLSAGLVFVVTRKLLVPHLMRKSA